MLRSIHIKRGIEYIDHIQRNAQRGSCNKGILSSVSYLIADQEPFFPEVHFIYRELHSYQSLDLDLFKQSSLSTICYIYIASFSTCYIYFSTIGLYVMRGVYIYTMAKKVLRGSSYMLVSTLV